MSVLLRTLSLICSLLLRMVILGGARYFVGAVLVPLWSSLGTPWHPFGCHFVIFGLPLEILGSFWRQSLNAVFGGSDVGR